MYQSLRRKTSCKRREHWVQGFGRNLWRSVLQDCAKDKSFDDVICNSTLLSSEDQWKEAWNRQKLRWSPAKSIRLEQAQLDWLKLDTKIQTWPQKRDGKERHSISLGRKVFRCRRIHLSYCSEFHRWLFHYTVALKREGKTWYGKSTQVLWK